MLGESRARCVNKFLLAPNQRYSNRLLLFVSTAYLILGLQRRAICEKEGNGQQCRRGRRVDSEKERERSFYSHGFALKKSSSKLE